MSKKLVLIVLIMVTAVVLGLPGGSKKRRVHRLTREVQLHGYGSAHGLGHDRSREHGRGHGFDHDFSRDHDRSFSDEEFGGYYSSSESSESDEHKRHHGHGKHHDIHKHHDSHESIEHHEPHLHAPDFPHRK